MSVCTCVLVCLRERSKFSESLPFHLARVCFDLIWGDGGEWGRRIEGKQVPGQWFP